MRLRLEYFEKSKAGSGLNYEKSRGYERFKMSAFVRRPATQKQLIVEQDGCNSAVVIEIFYAV